jgi:chitinase
VVTNVDSLNFGLGRRGKSKNAPNYADIIEKYTSADGYILHWDSVAMAPYLYSPKEKTFVTFDNRKSCSLKTKYALDAKLGGIMFWRINGDTGKSGLLDAIFETKESYR